MRTILLRSLGLALSATLLQAQSPTPTTYTLTQLESPYQKVLKTKIYQDGSKRVADQYGDGVDQPPHTREYNDLKTHDFTVWDLTDNNPPCHMGKSSGAGSRPANQPVKEKEKNFVDWENPFVLSAARADELLESHPELVGKETLNGFSVDLYILRGPEGEHKLWLEPKMKLIIKLQRTSPEAPPHTLLEVTELNLDAPPASVFDLPASCAADATPPKLPN
jgi:hypothetical protein